MLPDGAAASASAGAAGPIACAAADGPERIYGEWWKHAAEARRRPRLFPGRGRRRRPLLAVPPRRRRGPSAPATSAGTCTACSHDLRRAPGRRPISASCAASPARRNCSRPPRCSAIDALGIADRNTVGGLVKALRAAEDDRRAARRRLPARSDGRQRAAGLARGPRRLVAPHPPAHRRQEPRRSQEGREGPMLPPLGGCRRPGRTGWSPLWCRTRPTGVADIALAQMADIFGDARPSRAHPSPPPGRGDAAPRAGRAGARATACAASPPATCSTTGPTSACSRTSSPRSANKCTIDELGFRRERFADRHLKSAGGDGAPLRALPRRDPRQRRHRRALHLLAARAQLPISRRDRDVGPHARRTRWSSWPATRSRPNSRTACRTPIRICSSMS